MKVFLVIACLLTALSSLASSEDVLNFDLTAFDEDTYVEENKKAVILPLADEAHPFDGSKEPLILVHGIRGNPKDMQAIVNRFRDSRFQIYVLVYEDFKIRTSINGKNLSKLLGGFKKFKDVTIIAHSMGGIIVREALAEIVKKPKLLEDKKIRFFSIDTPWHGFEGPADDGFQMMFARPFLPDGLEDMRARSGMFEELNTITFPDNIEVDLAFAEEGEEAFGPLEIESCLTIPEQFVNFQNALSMSHQKEIPTFPGNHMSVLQGPYLDYLQQRL